MVNYFTNFFHIFILVIDVKGKENNIFLNKCRGISYNIGNCIDFIIQDIKKNIN